MSDAAPPSRTLSLAGDLPSGPAVERPRELTRLLEAGDDAQSARAWDDFLGAFGHLLLKTAHHTHRTHDAAMDAYARVLERLRQDRFRRLRAFTGGDAAALSRWLVVVARRICLDCWRERYGRPRESTSPSERDARRRLVDEVWDARKPVDLPGPAASDPEWQLRKEQRRRALAAVTSALPSRDQLLLALRFEDALSARQIAVIMGWPTPFHVYRRLNKLLASLQVKLRALGVDGPEP